MLGWRESNKYVVAKVLGPGPKAKHGLSSFEPDAPWQAEEGRRIYYASNRTIAYVGEWHTHPRGSTTPSALDISTMREIAEDNGFRAPLPLSVIAAPHRLFGRRSGWHISVYVWNGSTLSPVEYRQC